MQTGDRLPLRAGVGFGGKLANTMAAVLVAEVAATTESIVRAGCSAAVGVSTTIDQPEVGATKRATSGAARSWSKVCWRAYLWRLISRYRCSFCCSFYLLLPLLLLATKGSNQSLKPHK